MQRSDMPKIAATIRLAGELLELRGDRLLQYAAEFQKGYPTASEGPSAGGVSDPTFRMHLLPEDFLHEGEALPQWVEKAYQAAVAVKALDALLWPMTDEEARKALNQPKGRRSTVADCCERFCQDAAEKAGRCLACYQWKYRWEQNRAGEIAPPVPQAVIAEREQRRTA